jgi:hypothetical protein
MSALTAEIDRVLPLLDEKAAKIFEMHVQGLLENAKKMAHLKPSPSARTATALPPPQDLGFKIQSGSHKWMDWIDEAEAK